MLGCARVEFYPTEEANVSCPVEWYEIQRNEEPLGPRGTELVANTQANVFFLARANQGFLGK